MGFGKDGKGAIIREARSVALGTLAASTGLIIGTKLATTKDFRMLKSEIFASIVGGSSNELRSLQLFLVAGQYTLAEFEASLETEGPLDPNNTAAEEIALRPSWHAGSTLDEVIADEAVFRNVTGGGLMTIMPRWTFLEGKSWNWIVYNNGEAPTTGATLRIKAKNYGVWIR